MINTRTPTAKVFIFTVLSRNEANRILLENQKPAEKCWLLRESHYHGMLVVHSIDEQGNKNFDRYALTHQGWILLNKDKESVKEVRPQTIRAVKASQINNQDLLSLLNKLENEIGLTLANTINPTSWAVANPSYTEIYFDKQVVFFTKITDNNQNTHTSFSFIQLPYKIAEFLTCARKKNMLMVEPRAIKVENEIFWCDNSSLTETEKKAAYKDFRLRDIISCIIDSFVLLEAGNPTLAKHRFDQIEKEMEDPIHYTLMKKVYLSPSGHSYDEETFTQLKNLHRAKVNLNNNQHTLFLDPITKQTINSADFIDKSILSKLINSEEWKEFKIEREKELNVAIAADALKVSSIPLASGIETETTLADRTPFAPRSARK